MAAKAYVVQVASLAGFDGDREENYTREMMFEDYAAPQFEAVCGSSRTALRVGMVAATALYVELIGEELSGHLGEEERQQAQDDLDSLEWVEVTTNSSSSARYYYRDRRLDKSCPMRGPKTQTGRPNYVAMAIRRSKDNRRNWNHELCVVVLETPIEEDGDD